MRWCLWKFECFRNRFVSRVPTHTSTWNQGIDVEDFGVLNTKLGARTVRGQRKSRYHPSRLQGIFSVDP